MAHQQSPAGADPATWIEAIFIDDASADETLPRLAAGFGVSTATAWRYVDDTVEVLAAWAPGLREALTGLGEGDYVIVDSTPIPTNRIAADEPYYAQKHRKHGMNVQVIARPDGTPLWLSRATPGRVCRGEAGCSAARQLRRAETNRGSIPDRQSAGT